MKYSKEYSVIITQIVYICIDITVVTTRKMRGVKWRIVKEQDARRQFFGKNMR